MRHAADLMLDLKQHLAGFEIDDVLEPVLAAVALLGDQIVLFELLVRRGEILDIDLQMMPVKFGKRPVGLAENQLLVAADLDMRGLAVAVLLDIGERAEHLAIKAGNPLRGALRNRELDIGNAEIDLAETLLVRLKEAELVAPGTGRLDVVV